MRAEADAPPGGTGVAGGTGDDARGGGADALPAETGVAGGTGDDARGGGADAPPAETGVAGGTGDDARGGGADALRCLNHQRAALKPEQGGRRPRAA